jgi:hypothetical protein
MRRQALAITPYTVVIGGVGGVVWGFALDVSIVAALVLGLAVGAVVGAALGFFGGAASRGGLQDREAMFVSGSIVSMLSLMTVGLGAVVWLVRVIFF